MAKFVPGRPVETSRPKVTIDRGLRPGKHSFELVVVGRLGWRSKPQTLTVIVRG